MVASKSSSKKKKTPVSDEQIKNIESKFNFNKPSDFFEPKTLSFPVDKELLKNTFYTENNDTDNPASERPKPKSVRFWNPLIYTDKSLREFK